MTRKLKLLFILDPLAGLKAYKDSSIAMMRAAVRRGHAVWALQRAGLTWREGVVVGTGCVPLEVSDDDAAWYRAGESQALPLAAFDAVLMRQDPPFDFEYVTATWLLERAAQAGVRVFNDPRSVRDHSEKIAITEFPQFTATTLVARAAADIQAFIDELGDVILKPLAFDTSCTLPDVGQGPDAPPNRFYAYGVVARLALLAASVEIEETAPVEDEDALAA